MPDSRGPGVGRSRGGNVQLKNPGSLSNRCSTYGLKVLIELKRIHSEENNNNHMRDVEENVFKTCSNEKWEIVDAFDRHQFPESLFAENVTIERSLISK